MRVYGGSTEVLDRETRFLVAVRFPIPVRPGIAETIATQQQAAFSANNRGCSSQVAKAEPTQTFRTEKPRTETHGAELKGVCDLHDCLRLKVKVKLQLLKLLPRTPYTYRIWKTSLDRRSPQSRGRSGSCKSTNLQICPSAKSRIGHLHACRPSLFVIILLLIRYRIFIGRIILAMNHVKRVNKALAEEEQEDKRTVCPGHPRVVLGPCGKWQVAYGMDWRRILKHSACSLGQGPAHRFPCVFVRLPCCSPSPRTKTAGSAREEIMV